VYGRLDLIGNDELDGGGFERVLWIEPNHEVKNLILEKVPKKNVQYQTQGVKEEGARGKVGVRPRYKITSSDE
jgi:hypothetical protein